MSTDWSRLVRERVRASPSVSPAGGTALDCALELLDAGFGLKERDGGLIVVRPPGANISPEMAERIKAHKPLILALLRRLPEPVFPIGWEQEWRLELDGMLRRAAAMLPGPLRSELLALSGESARDEEDWLFLGAKLVDLLYRIGLACPAPQPTALTPWQGWMRAGPPGEWEKVPGACGGDWDEAWGALIRAVPATEHAEKILMPNGRHPDGRRRPR